MVEACYRREVEGDFPEEVVDDSEHKGHTRSSTTTVVVEEGTIQMVVVEVKMKSSLEVEADPNPWD